MMHTLINYVGPAGIVLLPLLAMLAVATLVQELRHDDRR